MVMSSRKALLAFAACAAGGFACTAVAETIAGRYDRAARFAAWNAGPLLLNADLRPRWSANGQALWYLLERPGGADLMVRRARDGAVLHRLDSARWLAAVAADTGLEPSRAALLAADPELSDDGKRLDLSSKGRRFSCPLAKPGCQATGAAGATANMARSPDGRRAVFVRDFNLWVRDLETGEDRPLTTDGRRHAAYASTSETALGILMGLPLPAEAAPAVIWSPDSRHLLTVRIDETQLGELPVVEQVPRDTLLPKVHTFRYGFVTEPGRLREQLYVVDTVGGTVRELQVETQPLTFDSTLFMRRAWWSADGRQLAVAIADPAERWIELHKVDPASGAARRLFREEHPRRVAIAGELQHPPAVALLSGGDIVWYSSRDGFGHLYRIDGETGAVRHALTQGPWTVHRLLFVDERAGWIYFAAGGDTYADEPYFASVYRVRLDGTRLARLTPETADHQVATEFIGPGAPAPVTSRGVAPDGRHFVSTASTPLQPEVSVLRAADGRVIAELGRARLSPLVAERYRPPERFSVPAPAGEEKLHGLLLFPSDFDPARKYPVIDAIYNGPQVVEHPRRFARTVFGEAQSLAELGFVVIVMDARGTPLRSRAFLEFSARHPDQVAGIGDHVHAIRALAASRPYMDLERVGVAGTSNGGYAALRAMLAYPEFFKVGVAANGSHDLRKYMPAGAPGVPAGQAGIDALADRANQNFVASLQGRLLLILGGMDSNVPLAASYGVVQALIDAGKSFDMVVVPRMGHDMSFDRFAVRRQWDYFVQHLRGESPPAEYRMPEPSSTQDEDVASD